MFLQTLRIETILRQFRRSEVFITVLNDNFFYFLMGFPIILFLIVAMLIFGTIRLWHIDPQSNIMFPLCGMRCGFEAVTPLAMAGNVNKASAMILHRWKKVRYVLDRTGGARHVKLFRMVHRSCKRIRCTSGSMYTFEHSIVLCCLNNCLQLTLNMLVSFGREV